LTVDASGPETGGIADRRMTGCRAIGFDGDLMKSFLSGKMEIFISVNCFLEII
jgi:hypothetical protein